MLVHGGSYRLTSPSISFQPSAFAANISTVDARVVDDHSVPEDIQSVVEKADKIMATVLEFRGNNPTRMII
ncbi:hypothetical protein C8J57DRAFT_1506278 [Mycena rebaudengoi]|nr:hypothetical protein C8J57DRAFT_1506278 [Mycena rebaudengoi]